MLTLFSGCALALPAHHATAFRLNAPFTTLRRALIVAIDSGEEDERRRMMSALFEPEQATFLDERNDLLGAVDSHMLLERDSDAGVASQLLTDDPDDPQMAFVDEFSCIGCKNCAEVSRSTFTMTVQGTARAYQQGADDRGVIEEAMDCCPVDCIHWTSKRELTIPR